MPRIYKLPEHIANLIAAGEVVERPGSVAKELIENALDAGAGRITVEIKSGGVAYLRVTDDGSGIVPEDVRIAFMRHATSKIRSEQDLSAIATLGFRGEALASVAAVARVDLFTRTGMNTEGVQIMLEGGEETGFSPTGCPVGTTVVIRDLFFNVPARAKFLKKDATEAAYVETAVVHAAIARPDVAFTLIKDGREALFTPGDGKMLSAIRAACGREVAENLLSTAGTHQRVAVDGFISCPTVSRANRNIQHFFVNGRPVRSRLLASALDQAYRGRLMGGRHPIYFLNLHMHGSAVDVNVHPAKLEVRFSHEREVFSAVYHAVQTSLDGLDLGFAREERPSQPAEAAEAAEPPVQQALILERARGGPTFGESYPGASQRAASGLVIGYQTRSAAPLSHAAPAMPPRPAAPLAAGGVSLEVRRDPAAAPIPPLPARPAIPNTQPDLDSLRLVGEAFKTYIVLEDAQSLWLLDKHAAHERILYNELTAHAGPVPGQVLLAPVTVALSRQEKAICLEHRAELMQAGFEVEDFGAGTVIVRQVPVYLEAADIPFALSDMAGRLLEERPAGSAVLETLLRSIACKRAVKAGQSASPAELEAFARQVAASPQVRTCPHGRPVLTRLSRREVEKLFGRTT